jgi:putative MATE family efflux protein
MKAKVTSRAIWAISLPIIIAGANETIVEVTDTIFLARYGMVELGAVALAAALFEVVSFFSLGLSDGIQIICARRAGQADDRGIGDAFNHGVALLLATSVVLFLFIRFVSPVATAWILQSVEVREAVDAFLAIAAFAVFFHGLNLAYSAFYVGIGRTRVLIAATAALALTNIALDYVLIFGNLGFPRLGIRGAALASLAAEVVTFAFLTGHAYFRGNLRRYGLFRFGRPSKRLARVMTDVSWPVALESLVSTGRWLLFFVIIERLGETPLAGANVVYSIYALFLLPIEGFSDATTTLVSQLIGGGGGGEIGGVVRRAVGSSAVLIVPFLLLAVAAPDLPLSLFTSEAAIVDSAGASLRVIALALVIVIPAEIVFAAVAGTGDTRSTLLIEVALSTTVLAWVGVTAIGMRASMPVVWAGEIAGWAICFLLSLLWLRSERWKRLDF